MKTGKVRRPTDWRTRMASEGNAEDVRCSAESEWKEVSSSSLLRCDRPSGHDGPHKANTPDNRQRISWVNPYE
jgi:hypothetical protein